MAKMQHDIPSSSNSGLLAPSSLSPLFFTPPNHRIPSPSYLDNGFNIPNLSQSLSHPVVNQSPSSPPIQGATSFSLIPSPNSFDDENPVSIENHLYLARLAFQYQQIADRYQLCFSQLQDAEREAETITMQNTKLYRANDVLCRLLNIDPSEKKFRTPVTTEYAPISHLDDSFRRLTLADPPDEESPTSVFGFQDNRPGDGRLTLPKSISVRSTGYLKMHQTGSSSCESNRSIRNRPPTPVMQQKVYVGATGKKDTGEAEDPVQVDLYNQGMFKTELCNKWQEAGECPYGEHCQFAHGIDELRPIIRHPRYKTELCRMVLAGDTCPYGHRCHFRHVISPQDRVRPR